MWVRVRRHPDRDRLLNRTWEHCQVLEGVVLTVIVRRLLAGDQPEDLDGFLHPSHPRTRLDVEVREFLVEPATVLTGSSLTGDEGGSPTRQEVEAAPLISEQARVAQRGACEARRSDAEPVGGGRNRRIRVSESIGAWQKIE